MSRADRRPYEKPTVLRIELEPQEVLATGCKLVTAGGPGNFTCVQVACVSLTGS